MVFNFGENDVFHIWIHADSRGYKAACDHRGGVCVAVAHIACDAGHHDLPFWIELADAAHADALATHYIHVCARVIFAPVFQHAWLIFFWA